MNAMLLQIIAYIITISGHNLNPNMLNFKIVSFDYFSMQILTLINIIPLFLFLQLKNLSLISKVSKYGVYVVFGYMVFIIYIFVENIITYNNGKNLFPWEIKWFTWDIGNLAGTGNL